MDARASAASPLAHDGRRDRAYWRRRGSLIAAAGLSVAPLGWNHLEACAAPAAAHAFSLQTAPDQPWALPPGTLALFVSDPRDDASVGAAVGTIEAMLASALEDAGEPWPAGTGALLRAAAEFDGAKRLGLVRTDAGPGVVFEASGTGAQLEAALGAVRAMIEPGSEREGAGASHAALAGGGQIAWVVEGAGMVVGLGEGSLQAWRGGRGGERDGEWRSHLDAAGGATGPGASVYIDVNALRRALPESAAKGGVERLLRAWDVENARGLGLHARASAEGAALAATWSARSEEPGRVRRASVALAPDERGVVVRGLPVRAVVEAVVEAQGSNLSRWGAVEYTARWSTWQRKHGESLTRLVDLLAGEAIVRATTEGGSVVLPVQGDAQQAAALLRTMMRESRGFRATGSDAWRAELSGSAGLPREVRIRFEEGVVVEWE